MCKVKIKCDGVMQLSEVVANLEKLAQDMKTGVVNLSSGEECLTLQPPVLVTIAMKASQKKDKEKFCLELSWRTSQATDDATTGRVDGASVTTWSPLRTDVA